MDKTGKAIMWSPDGQCSNDAVADLMGHFRDKGVRLWSEDGRLHYKAPRGALTQDEIEKLRAFKSELIALVKSKTAIEPNTAVPEAARRLQRAPLAFSQMAHWHFYRLCERSAMRQIASATRILGRLDVNALERGMTEVVHRHDALRTRIVASKEGLYQEVNQRAEFELAFQDLTTLAEGTRERELTRLIEELIVERVDVCVDPLFRAQLVRLRAREHVLIVAMEHLISDAYSMSILIGDIFSAYVQTLRHQVVSLPKVAAQFTDYAVWVNETHRARQEKHGTQWTKCLTEGKRLRFPSDVHVHDASDLGWGTAPIRIAVDLKEELLEWCRARQTTLVMGVFTAYAALVLRWCNASELIVRYQSDGRVNRIYNNTVGYFATVLYVRCALTGYDRFIEIKNRLTDEYCRAYECADFSYMDAQVPRPEFVQNTAFNWVPHGSAIDVYDLDDSADAITLSPVSFEHPILKTLQADEEPGILLHEGQGEIVGGVHFPLSRFSVGLMDRFACNFMQFIRTMIREPGICVQDIPLL